MPEIITRAEAKARGLKRYFTGKACPRGHLAERFVSSPICLECARSKARRWAHENPVKIACYHQRYKARNPERVKESQRRSKQRPDAIERARALDRAYKEKHKEKYREIARKKQRRAYIALRALKELGIEV